jgi:hypothetical protein
MESFLLHIERFRNFEFHTKSKKQENGVPQNNCRTLSSKKINGFVLPLHTHTYTHVLPIYRRLKELISLRRGGRGGGGGRIIHETY